MQLKMRETIKTSVNTPTGIKKTPKKIKETTMKKDETTKGTKTISDTPKPNKNVTPKQREQNKIPGKDQETPQSKPGTPKTPESGSGYKKRRRSNKKQKLDENKSKEINTHSSSEPNKKATSDFKKRTPVVKGSRIRVRFPPSEALTYDDIQEVFAGCENILLNMPVIMEYEPEIAPKKLDELRKLRYLGRKLKIDTTLGKLNLLKRTIMLVNDKDVEKAKKFFNAKSIDKFVLQEKISNIYILTFDTEEKAASASEMTFKSGDNECFLQLYFERGIRHEAAEEGKKSIETKRKQVQMKRKAEEDEESDEEEEGDSTMEGSKIDGDLMANSTTKTTTMTSKLK